MKAAVVQLHATNDKKENINKAVDFVARAIKKNAKFVLLPELFVYRGKLPIGKNRVNIVETTGGPTVKIFSAMAKQNKINILLGSIYERSAHPKKAYNTSILINDKGKIVAKYRKINLFSAQLGKTSIREKDFFLTGKTVASGKAGGFLTGLSVCYDLRFPEVYRRYARQKADIITVPSNFTKKTGQAHWKPLLRARAIEQLCYVLAPSQVGEDYRKAASYGHSMIVSPWGEVLAEASGNREEIIYANLDKKEILKARKRLPGII